jgi:hypothetical protein
VKGLPADSEAAACIVASVYIREVPGPRHTRRPRPRLQAGAEALDRTLPSRVPHPGRLPRMKRGKRRMDEKRMRMVVDYTYCISC